MSRVFTSESTGAAVYVFSDDHCPPHVHARHRGDGWIARVEFSYLNSSIELMSIAPSRNSPQRRTVNHLLADIQIQLPACRRIWWMTRQTTCLVNQWAIVLTPERVELVFELAANAKQITAALYDPAKEQLRMTFQNGTIADVSAGT